MLGGSPDTPLTSAPAPRVPVPQSFHLQSGLLSPPPWVTPEMKQGPAGGVTAGCRPLPFSVRCAPHSGSPLYHTLPSRGPRALGSGVHGEGCGHWAGLHVELGVSPAGSCVPGASSNPHLCRGHPRSSTSSPGAGLLEPPAPPEMTAEGRGCCLPPPPTRRRLSSGRRCCADTTGPPQAHLERRPTAKATDLGGRGWASKRLTSFPQEQRP